MFYQLSGYHVLNIHLNCATFEYTKNQRYQREKIQYDVVDSIIEAKVRSIQYPRAQSEVASDDLEQFDTGSEVNEPTTSDIQQSVNIQQQQQQQSKASTDNPSFAEYAQYVSPSTSSGKADSDFVTTQSELALVGEQHLVTNKDMNDMQRDFNLSDIQREQIASRLKQWLLVSDDFLITGARKRKLTKNFDELFETAAFKLPNDDVTRHITYCINVEELFEQVEHPHNPPEWRLFIDASKTSLKCVLLHNGNQFPSVPIAY